MLATSTIAFDTLQIVDTIILDKIPTCIAINEETNLLYVGVPDALLVIDGDSHNIVADIPLEMDDIIEDIEVNPETNRIYVAYRPRGGPDKIVVFDGVTNQPIGEMIEHIFHQYQIAINPATNFIYIAETSYFVGSPD
jgi:DNA-binding beta-propeller fold protein YncE